MATKLEAAEPSPESERHEAGPKDERHDARGRVARQQVAEPEVTVRGGSLAPLVAYLVVAVLGAGGGGIFGANFKGKDDGKLDQVLVAQKSISDAQKEIADAQKRIETRLTTLEAQGTSGRLETIEARLRHTEEELAGLRALQGHGR